jgi:hypothetical protein
MFEFDAEGRSRVAQLPLPHEWQRRNVLQLAALVVLGSFFSATGVGCTPATTDRGVRQQVGSRARQAQSLLEFVVDAGEEQQSDAVDRFQVEQREISYGLASILNTKVKPDEWLSFASPVEFELAIEMELRHVRLVPTERDFAATIERPLTSVDNEEGEPILDVLLTIILDALDIFDALKEVKEFLNNNHRLRAMFIVLVSSIKGALKDRRFADVTMNFRKFLELLVAHETLTELEAKLGKEKIARLLASISARFVPFIGWSLFVASLLVSIYRNWERLTKADFKF